MDLAYEQLHRTCPKDSLFISHDRDTCSFMFISPFSQYLGQGNSLDVTSDNKNMAHIHNKILFGNNKKWNHELGR